jgi:hypothetical protein
VLVALDPGVPQETALAAVASVAGGDVAEVLGLFVEDMALLSLARLPAVREITVEAAERVLSAEQVERQFRAQAARLRSLFESGAARAGFRYRFEVARGEVNREILRAAAACDVLVVTHSRQQVLQTLVARLAFPELPVPGPQTLVFVQERWLTGRRVAVLFRGSEDQGPLERARDLAQTERLSLAVVVPGGATPMTAVRASVDAILGPGHGARIRGISRPDVAFLAQAVTAEDARVLVLPGALVAGTPRLIPELLQRVECSVIAIREVTQQSCHTADCQHHE